MISDETYSAVAKHIVANVLSSMIADDEGDLSYFQIEDYGNELIVDITVMGYRKTISISVVDIITPDIVEQYLFELVQDRSGRVSKYIFAMRNKLRSR